MKELLMKRKTVIYSLVRRWFLCEELSEDLWPHRVVSSQPEKGKTSASAKPGARTTGTLLGESIALIL